MNSTTRKVANPHPMHLYGDVQRIATIFNWFAGVMLFSLLVGIFIVLSNGDFGDAIILGLGILPTLLAFYLIRRRKFEGAAIFMALFMITLMTLLAVRGWGVHHISVMGYPAILIVASMVMRKRTMVLLTIYNIACVAWLVFGEMAGAFSTGLNDTPVPGDFFSTSLILVGTAVMVRLITESLFQSNWQLQKELAERKLAEQALDFSEKRFHQAFHSSPVMMTIEGADHRFVDVNQAFCEALGYTRDEVLGRTASDLNLWASSDDVDMVQKLTEEQQGLKNLELRFRRRSGDIGWLLMSSDKFEVNGMTYELTSGLDITERKQADRLIRESEERYRLISSVTSDYTFSTKIDGDGNMSLNWVAGAFETMTGYTMDEYKAHGGWLAHLYPEDVEKDLQALAKLKNNQSVMHEIRTITKTKKLQWVQVYAHPIWDENTSHLVGIVGAVQDITARKQAEAELQKSASRLELLHNIDRALLSEQSPAETAREALTRIRQLIPSQRTSITLFDFEKNEATFLVTSFDDDFNPAGPSAIMLQEYGQYIIDELLQGKACRVDDALTDPRCNELDQALAQKGFRCWLYLPLLSQGQLIGGLNFGRAAGNPFTAAEESIAHEVANQLAIVLKQNQLYESLQAELSERRRVQDILFEEKERAEVTLYSIGDAVITTDIHAQVDYLNPVAENLTGWKLKEAIGQPLEKVFQVVNEEGRKPVIDPVARCLQEGRVFELANHSLLIRRDGSEYSIDDSAAPIRNRKGEIIGAVLVFHDITEERRLSRQVAHDAMHDSLTGLVNRREFEKRLGRALNNARERNLSHVLCYLDLDQFKIVNDTAGHAAGDELLKQVGKLLSDLFRQRDTLARLGGDEFGLLLENCQLDQALVICNEILAKVRDFAFIWAGNNFQVGVSIGVVPITSETESVVQLLSRADVACYSAKDLGRNRVYVYQTEDSETVQRHSDIVQASRMKDAIIHNQFLLYCQPIVEFAGDHLGFNHYEVLLRMVNDEKNLVLPGAFIPSAERYGLMPAIDRWVIRQTFCAMSTHDIQGMKITINLSGNSLDDENLLEYVLEQLNEFSILPEQICFEITETAAIQHLSNAQKFIQAFRARGGKIALDDFGSGFSSFRYLRTLTVDYLKIDGAFVSDMLSNPSDHAMVEAITQMAHTLGIHVIAEHAFNLETINRLREMGVESVQGFGIGFPVPVEEAWKSLGPGGR